jgi:hypothetical protein
MRFLQYIDTSYVDAVSGRLGSAPIIKREPSTVFWRMVRLKYFSIIVLKQSFNLYEICFIPKKIFNALNVL